MNSNDLFRKLTNGAKFDLKKYNEDAKKFKMISEKVKEDQAITEIEPIENSKGKKKKKNKTKEQLAEQQKEQIAHLRKINRINVNGSDVPDPIDSFDKMNINETLLNNIKSNGFTEPTPIQMQIIPLMMDQRELIGCAPTGSGKTLAFLIPILQQLKRPQKLGFRAVILAPTRELAKQIHREALWISAGTGLRIHIIKNTNLAMKKFGQKSGLKYDILVTTPNRLAFLLQQEPPGVNIKNIEWLIIDECDRLFEKGFRDQLSVIYNSCSESSKVRHAMFSATFDPNLEKWAKINLDNIVTVIVGGKNKTAQMVEQQLLFVGNEEGKLVALRNLILTGCQAPVLIFVETIEKAKELFSELLYDGVNVDVIHSERTQLQRDNVVRAFREGKVWFLICSELMGRGIDFKGVNLVINYDFPQSSVSYIHRIGRTGRAGRQGKAITFFTEEDSEQLKSIANVMKQSGCDVPKFMLEIGKKRKRKMMNKKILESNKNKLATNKKLKTNK